MRVFIILLVVLFFAKCARQTQPNGGPKDTDPPELLSSTPANGEKNFNGNNIELTFDENVKLKDPKEEILITPSLGAGTRFSVKKNKVIITPEYKWADSTTYSIAFREGIQDINESNPTDDLHLAFSTGPTIDSLKIVGSISEIFTDKIPEKITIGLYQADTFDIFKHKPALFSKSNKSGIFSILNLKPGRYFVYAFDDKNKNQKVDSKTERFGFLATGVNLPKDKDTLRIPLFHLDTRPIKLTSLRNTSSISIIRFNKALDSLRLSTQTSSIIYTYGDTKAEVIVYKEFDKKDSLKINIYAADSSHQKLDTTVYAKFTDTKIIPEKFKLSAWKINYDVASNLLIAENSSNKLLLSINYDSIYIQIDTVNFQQILPKEITVDTLHKTIQLKTNLKINPKEKIPSPILLLGKGAFVSIDNDSSKSQDIKIQIPKPEATGTVSVELNTKEPHFQLLLTSASSNTVAKSLRDTKKYTFTHLEPGEYKITVLVDTNNNKRWDPGDFYKKEEPERVILYKTLENKNSFPVRANWELGPLVIKF
jgi:uncharacterized protein (DUF2141 family)